MRYLLAVLTIAALTLVSSSGHAQGAKPRTKCPIDSVVSGTVCTVCMDKYEADVRALFLRTT